MVDKVELGQIFSEYNGFPCQFAFHRLLNNHHHLSSGAGWPQYKEPHEEKKRGVGSLIDETGELPGNIYPLPLSVTRLQYNRKANWEKELNTVSKRMKRQDSTMRGQTLQFVNLICGLFIKFDERFIIYMRKFMHGLM
jgi:hypothetical protein